MIAPVGSEVVVDHVEDHAQTKRMGPVDEPTHVVRGAVSVVGREQIDAIVAPAERARELGDRHDLHRRDAQVHESRQAPGRGLPGPLGGEGPQVQLVDDLALEDQAFPCIISPPVKTGIDHLGGAVRPFRLVSRCRVRIRVPPIEPVAIARPVPHARNQPGEVSVTLRFELELFRSRLGPRLEEHLDEAALRRPDAEMDPSALDLCADRQPARRGGMILVDTGGGIGRCRAHDGCPCREFVLSGIEAWDCDTCLSQSIASSRPVRLRRAPSWP